MMTILSDSKRETAQESPVEPSIAVDDDIPF